MYPGFVFGFTDNITRSKTIVCCAGDLLINPTFSDCTQAVKPLSAFCLWVRSDAKPGKALSLLSLSYFHAGFKWSDFFAKITD